MKEEEDARIKIVVCKMDFSGAVASERAKKRRKNLLVRSSSAGGAHINTFIFIHNAQLCVLFFIHKMFGLIKHT